MLNERIVRASTADRRRSSRDELLEPSRLAAISFLRSSMTPSGSFGTTVGSTYRARSRSAITVQLLVGQVLHEGRKLLSFAC